MKDSALLTTILLRELPAHSYSLAEREQLAYFRGTMDWRERISIDPKVLVGKPVIKGTRIAVEFLVELLAEGWTHVQILQNYPHLTEADIQAALHYASEMMKQEKVYPLTL